MLRPTLVYDGRADRNVARMIRLARRARVLPIARPSSGLRQPIHVDDVAKAILGALDEPRAQDRAFDIAGGEVMTYRAMAERVFESQGLRPRFLVLPVPWLRLAFGLAARIGIVRETGFGSAGLRPHEPGPRLRRRRRVGGAGLRAAPLRTADGGMSRGGNASR